MKWISTLGISLIFLTSVSLAQNNADVFLAQRVEQLRLAMLNADSMQLDAIAHPLLSYGHSSGALDNRDQFIQKIVSGKSDFVTLEFGAVQSIVTGKTALVRHALDATTNDNGKPGEVHLQVLLVWVKEKGKWRLLGRQAVKRPV